MPIPAPGLAPQTTWEVVTPETAAKWLKTNVNNRALSRRSVERYSADMKNNMWQNTGDPIRFSKSGRLLDGQHRLTAIVESGVTISMLVIRDLEDRSQDAMDQGRARTAADVLSLHGERNTGQLAAAVKLFLVWDRGLLCKDIRKSAEITNSVIAEWVSAHHAEVELFQHVAATIRKNDAPQSVAGAAFIGFARIDANKAVEFMNLLANGAGGMGHPITTLDKRMQRMRREGLKMAPRDYLAMFIQAWNAWRDGRELQKFQRPRGLMWTADSFPVAH